MIPARDLFRLWAGLSLLIVIVAVAAMFGTDDAPAPTPTALPWLAEAGK